MNVAAQRSSIILEDSTVLYCTALSKKLFAVTEWRWYRSVANGEKGENRKAIVLGGKWKLENYF